MLSGSTVAHAAVTDVRMVDGLMHYDETGALVDPNTGWGADSRGTGRVEIGSAYRAPTGLGRDSLMFDTPAAGDWASATALTNQPTYIGAFPEGLRASPDLRLGFWLYRSSASTSGASPVLGGWIGIRGTGAAYGYAVATFDAVANGYTDLDRWMLVDAMAPNAVWSVQSAWSSGPAQSMTWPEIVDHTRGSYLGQDVWGGFEYGLHFLQDGPGAFSAIDGVRVTTNEWSILTDFELRAASGRPVLDGCKNNGWHENYPALTFKNQGDCIAAIVAQN